MTAPPPAARRTGTSHGSGDSGGSARRWRHTGHALLARLISELAYEELLLPELDADAGPIAPAIPPPDPGHPPYGQAHPPTRPTHSSHGQGDPPTGSGDLGPGQAHPPTGAAHPPHGQADPPVGRGVARAYRIRTGPATYTFLARRGTFGSWWIDNATLSRTTRAAGSASRPADDPIRFLRDAQSLLGWSDAALADVVRDLLATQAADHRLLAAGKTAAELAELPFVALEGHQTGHPCLVANKGRLGFGAADTVYTPEARTPFRLIWVAAHSTIGRYSSSGTAGTSPVTSADLLAEELDAGTRTRFAAVLAAAVTPRSADYVWLPVHPWQWENVIAPLYAAEVATGLLVPLGEAPDRYLPLQAVRTLANIDRPDRRNVKLALMIRNTLVWRGMSPADAVAGPAVSRWLLDLRDSDPFLRDVTRVLPLPEVAGATVAHPVYDSLPDAPYRLHELLGVLWRDPVERFLDTGERARSLASLLAVGGDGRALVTELVARSGRSAREWCAALLTALLPPLLHYLYRYGVAFTPHGENVVCVFDADEMPRRIAVKDFGADIELVDGDFPERHGLPAEGAEHCRRWPGPVLAHSLLSAVFAGHFRFFSVLVADHLHIGEEEFWRLVRSTIEGYQDRFPTLAHRFEMIDLFVPRFDRVCLNREQFAGAGFHERADRDGGFDLMHGHVVNPLRSTSAVAARVAAGTASRASNLSSPERAPQAAPTAVPAAVPSQPERAGQRSAGRETVRELLAGTDPVDEIIVATVDLQGRLVGSGLSPEYFAEQVLVDGLGACTYLYAVDVDMTTDGDYAYAPWQGGFGDLRLTPDLSTLRRAPWLASSAVVLADASWPDGATVDVAPRAVLRAQLDALAEAGLTAFAGTELEFLVFHESYRRAARRSYTGLTPASRYNIDYALTGTEGLDDLVRRIRRAMADAGVAVESARGEVHPGQFEIVFRYAEAMRACDNHTLYKTAAKKIAAAAGQALTFMAKYDEGEGNSCHVHLSLRGPDGTPVFAAPAHPEGTQPADTRTDTAGMSPLMRSFVAGQLACMADFALLYAPNVNSYKRLAPGAFAPTGVSWGRDNRTSAIRVVGSGSGLRIEHRVPGGDANPYLAVAGMIAAGRYGIERDLPLEPGRVGNTFTMAEVPRLPTTLREAIGRWRASTAARAAFGDRVVAHLAHAAEVELASYERTVTDWERQRGFERL